MFEELSSGLRTKYIAHLAAGNQSTTYNYGTTKGSLISDSKIATGHLLGSTIPADASTAEMHYAYDAQSRQIWKSDAAGTEHQMIFSDGGRLFEDRVVAVGSAVDGTVRLRRYLYNTKGRLESVTQWDNATPGGGATPLDEAAFYFDDWGKLAVAQTDVDSGVGGAGEPTYEIDYEWHKAGPAGRRVVRPDSATYPSGDRLEYRYNGADYNEELSRPNAMVMFAGGGTAGVTKSTSEYLGWGQLTTFAYSTTDIQMTIMGPPTSGGSPQISSLDQFGRRTKLRWARTTSNGTFTLLNVEIDGDRMYVTISGYPGGVLLYERVGGVWSKTHEFLEPFIGTQDWGYTVAVDRGRVAIGSRRGGGSLQARKISFAFMPSNHPVVGPSSRTSGSPVQEWILGTIRISDEAWIWMVTGWS